MIYKSHTLIKMKEALDCQSGDILECRKKSKLLKMLYRIVLLGYYNDKHKISFFYMASAILIFLCRQTYLRNFLCEYHKYVEEISERYVTVERVNLLNF